jgi:2-polyprenyl-6-methoxyphenol hydroxylase-like FAD-dependent oxidoreductase
MKRRDPAHDITVFERDPRSSTYGWGVVYRDDLLDQLRATDPETGHSIWENSMRWRDQVLDVGGTLTVHPGRGGYGIGRQRLLEILAARATELGVQLRFAYEVESSSQIPDAELIVACDGVGSRLRQLHVNQFKTRVAVGRNKYIWLGTHKVFDAFTFAVVETDAGWIWFHGYRFDNDTSTCVVECPPETWAGLRLDTLRPDAALHLLSRIFTRTLDGYALLNRGSRWLNFGAVTNERWHHDNVVLMGDAAHTTHFTIGSGTKLALEDAMALTTALHEHKDLESALDGYESERQAALRQPQSEARLSAQWFENISRYAGLSDRQFFTLLRQRTSPLLPRLPPLVYYRLHQLTQQVPVLRRLRQRIGPKVRAAYSRRRG